MVFRCFVNSLLTTTFYRGETFVSTALNVYQTVGWRGKESSAIPLTSFLTVASQILPMCLMDPHQTLDESVGTEPAPGATAEKGNHRPCLE